MLVMLTLAHFLDELAARNTCHYSHGTYSEEKWGNGVKLLCYFCPSRVKGVFKFSFKVVWP